MRRPYIVSAAVAFSVHAALFLSGTTEGDPAFAKQEKPSVSTARSVPSDQLEVVEYSERLPREAVDPPPSARAQREPSRFEMNHDLRAGPAVRAEIAFAPVSSTEVQIVVPGTFRTSDSAFVVSGPGELGEVMELRRLDKTPAARWQKPAQYPREHRQAGESGEVLVEFVVGLDGRVVSARALKATSPAFERAALAAVEHWRFDPGTRNGRPVRFRMVLPMMFNISQEI